MNLKTTLALVVLAGCAAGLVYTHGQLPRGWRYTSTTTARDAGSRRVLEAITPDRIKGIEIRRSRSRLSSQAAAGAVSVVAQAAGGGLVPLASARLAEPREEVITIRRAADGSWVMPGNWPTRAAEVRRLVDLLTSLRSRFDPIPLTDDDTKKQLGLDAPAVTVIVDTGKRKHTLLFADKDIDEDSTRFDSPTFVQVDDIEEVLRLGPGLVTALERPADYYLQRRLFPSQRVPRDEGATARVDRLDGTRLAVDEPERNRRFIIEKKNGAWELTEPYRDAVDPGVRDRLLEAVADLWAERFLDGDQAKDLDNLGLKKPDRIITVTRKDGGQLKLEIGKPAFGAGLKPRNFARLAGFERTFEINGDALNNIFVSLDTLRDNQLARFSASNAREVEITTTKGTVVLRNTTKKPSSTDAPPPPSDWRIVKPIDASADAALVDRLLSSLSGASATDKDVLLKSELTAVVASVTQPAFNPLTALGPAFLVQPAREFGLAPPAATIVVRVEEGKRTNEPKTKKTFTIRLGRHDRAAKKLFATSQDWPRFNEIDDALAELVLDKSALDFRGKRVLDFVSSDVDRLEVRQLDLSTLGAGAVGLMTTPPTMARLGPVVAALADDSMGLTLQHGSDGWKLAAPVKAEADATKASDLADRLGKLEVLAWVAEQTAPAELQTKYGLGVPALSVTIGFSDAKKPPRTLQVGKSRTGSSGYYARLEGQPEVFAIAGDLLPLLQRDSLAYRPSSLWQVAGGDEVVKLQIAKAGQAEYSLQRKGDDWEVAGPFTVKAPREVVDKLVQALQFPRVQEYRAHTASDYSPFGLATPEVKVTLTTKSGKSHTLLVGKETTKGTPGRFARLDTPGAAVFVVADSLARTVDQSALDFLDRQLLRFDPQAVTSFTRQQGEAVLELAKKDDAWRLVRPLDLPADEKKVPELMKLLSELKAQRIAAYQPKDPKVFGLEKPEATLTIKLAGDAKPAEHVLLIGAEVKGKPGQRYAQMKGSPMVAELARATVDRLLAGPLAYRDHLLARLPDADTIKLEMGDRKLTLSKPEGTWKLTQPLATDAEHDALESLLNGLARLRADELVAEKPTAEQLKSFGLDKPAARWQFLSGDEVKLDLLVGQMEKTGPRRYTRIEGNDLVFLLDLKLSGQLVAEYRPRAVFKENIDPAQIEAVKFGYRKDAFELKKVDGNWQVVGKPDVKVDDKAVSDCLSALRDLKLERYVKDAGAQLKLYDLDPPELLLEVTTPSGQHTLHIGGLEGGTRKRYARVPVAGRADVFVLDEATSTKLVRDLAALTRK
jgi:hypothetical protein